MSKVGLTAVTVLLLHARAFGAEAWQVRRGIAEFDRFDIVQPEAVYAIRKAGELKVPGQCITGGVECDVAVPRTGWYELLVEPAGGLNEYVIDGKLSVWAGEHRKLRSQQRYGKVDNLWLAKGPHTIRVQRHIWWGFSPAVRSILLRASGAGLGGTLRVACAHGPGEAIVRKGEDLALTVYTAGRDRPASLGVRLADKRSGRIDAATAVELPAGRDLRKVPVRLRCSTEGIFQVAFLDGQEPISTRDLRPVTVCVVDTTPVKRRAGRLRKTLLAEIDCAATAPHYVHGGATRVVSKPLGKYRLSGDVGFLHAQHHNRPESWFAYKLATADVGKCHLLEVDYPDDDLRTFLIVVRESSPDAYPVAGGVDSGGCWSLSNRMQTHSILFWPKTAGQRVAFLAAHNGRRAAAGRIRLYRIEGDVPPLDVPLAGGRTFVNWYEEGSNFTGFYGGAKGGLTAYLKSAEMWPRELCYMGGDTIMPTVSVYQMSLYPSRYNHHHAEMTTLDVVRLLLLNCERYGVKLVAEFHPEARELEYPRGPGRRDNGLVSKDGKVCTYATHGPMHHPLHRRNRQWYLGMIGELAERYKDSPAFAGVSLRCMSWANPALNNFHSLDWGYGDETVWQFEKDTATNVAAAAVGPERFAKRHEWLMRNARRKWIDWRCDRIAELHRRIVARVRRARKDLRVHLTVFDLGEEAGLDAGKLSAIDGLVLVNARHAYGRQALTYRGFLADQEMRDNLLDPAVLHSTRGKSAPAAMLFGARYFEATERVLKPGDLHLPPDKRKKWISGVVNPAGRHYLERYAVALAETDATLLGDGGNAYTLGQPLLREFNREFRRLPRRAFTPRKDARDPVAVWELARTDDLLFYAVNRERYGVGVAISMQPGGPVRRLATGREVKLAAGRLEIRLQPYQLIAFRAPAGARISSVSTTVPPAARAHVQAMADALAELRASVAAGAVKLDVRAGELLDATVKEARKCLTEGRLWRARTMLEHHRLAREVYGPALAFPPTLSRLIDPRRMRVLKARGMPKPTGALLHLSFDGPLAGGKLPVAGGGGLQARCEGGCELREGKLGKALRLDGKTGRVVVEGAGLVGLDRKDLTLCAWINAEGVSLRRGIAARQKWPAGFALLLWNGSVLAEAGAKAGNNSCRTHDSLCRAGVWYHIAATVVSGKTITLYVDGEQVKKVKMDHEVGGADGPLVIGWSGWGGRQNDPSPGPFAGRIDELKIWNRALSGDEVLAEMAGR